MARRQPVVMSSVSAALAALVLAGCGGGTGAGTRAAREPSTSGAVASPTPRPPSPGEAAAADPVCTGVQAVIGHLTADTAGWSPMTDPFDRAVSQRIRLRSSQLARQAPAGSPPGIVKAVDATARAFTTVSTAMRSKDRARVARAIDGSRVAYRQLKRACPPR